MTVSNRAHESLLRSLCLTAWVGVAFASGCAPAKAPDSAEPPKSAKSGTAAPAASKVQPPAPELRDAPSTEASAAAEQGGSAMQGSATDQGKGQSGDSKGPDSKGPDSKGADPEPTEPESKKPQGPPPHPPLTLAPDGGDELTGDAKTLRDALIAKLKKDGIEVDLKARTVSIGIEVVQPVDPLEYVLIHKKGKDHESLLMTMVKPSLLNAALGLLGLRPGINAKVTMKDPAPTFEEVEAGADPMILTPPGGMRVWMTAAFSVDGERKVFPLEDLVIDLTTGLPMADNQWVFLGGNKAPMYRNEPPVFMADYEGNLVSAVYMTPPNHLVTNRHPRARDEFNWWVAKVCPQPGSVGKLTFHVRKPAVYQGRTERLAKMAAEMKEKGEADNTIDREPSDGPRRR